MKTQTFKKVIPPGFLERERQFREYLKQKITLVLLILSSLLNLFFLLSWNYA